MSSRLTWERKVLSNGITVLLYTQPTRNTAQISVAIKYGSNDDLKEKLGKAHFLEHMLVSGSKKRISLHHKIEDSGGYSYFETSNDRTFCGVDVIPEKIVDAAEVFSELLFNTEFEKDKLELERKIILNEIAESSDNPQNKIEEAFIKCLFNHHPVRNPILGTKKTVNQISLSDMEKSHQEHYTPQNMILILTGACSDIDAKIILDNFLEIENTGLITMNQRKSEENNPQKEKVLERSGITQAYMSFGLRTAPAKSPDTPSLDLINSILGTGESSRLFAELREKRALTYDFESINVSGLDYGYFVINCASKRKAVRQIETIVQAELEKIKTYPTTKTELEKSKNLMIGTIFRNIDNSRELPRILADSEIYFENENALQQYINKIIQLTEKDITKTAKKYFQENNYSKAVLIPKSEKTA